MNNIRLLPETTANQIASGEVAPAPANVVKELLENAVDAGAKNIRLETKGAGRDLIVVSDDGKGMNKEDARMAFERHATSKIYEIEDLDKLSTLGFRGEALAAISAISEVEMRTREHEATLGTEIHIKGGMVESVSSCTTLEGTIMKVKNLFFNVPQRRRFLSEDFSKDERKIYKELEHIALVHPEIHFSYYVEDKLKLDLPSGTLMQRIISLSKKNINKALLPLQFESPILKVSGYIATPETAKHKSKQRKYLFVNDRYVEHYGIRSAIERAYEGLIDPEKRIDYFVYLRVPTMDLDVNLSPSKTEVRFAHEEMIKELLFKLTRETLSAHAAVPTIDFEQREVIEIPAYEGRRKGWASSSSGYSRAGSSTSFTSFGETSSKSAVYDWEELSRNFEVAEPPTISSFPSEEISPAEEPHWVLFGQEELPSESRPTFSLEEGDILRYGRKYILAGWGGRLALVSLERAQERVRYDSFFRDLSSGRDTISEQHQIAPELLELDVDQLEVAERLMKLLEPYGFDFGQLGRGSYSILASPHSFSGISLAPLLEQLVERAMEVDDWEGEVIPHFLASIAARLVAKVERPATLPEVKHLLEALAESKDPILTPGGKKIMVLLEEKDLDNFFN